MQKIVLFLCMAEVALKETGRKRRQTPGTGARPRCLAIDYCTACLKESLS